MSFGLTAESDFCTAWLQVVEKITRQVDLFSEEGSAAAVASLPGIATSSGAAFWIGNVRSASFFRDCSIE